MAPLHLRIIGRVHGVGFRHFVYQSAHRWQLAGWVRNCSDGSVEVAADGSLEAREGLLAAVRRGPPGATVEEIVQLSIDDIEPPPATPFRILR